MPVKLLTQESFAEGFGEGSEDAKAVARYMDRLRETMDPVYRFLDRIVMHRAWTPPFFKSLRRKFPEKYGDMTYREAFYEWANCFLAVWPSYLREPDSDQVKVDDTKMKAAISIFQILDINFDPENRVRLVHWLADAITNNKLLYSSPLEVDYDVLRDHLMLMFEQEQQQQQISMAGAAAGAVGGEGGKPGGGEPGDKNAHGFTREISLPKVKMARADDAVVKIIEHVKRNAAKG